MPIEQRTITLDTITYTDTQTVSGSSTPIDLGDCEVQLVKEITECSFDSKQAEINALLSDGYTLKVDEECRRVYEKLDPPPPDNIANDDSAEVNEGESVTINVIANDVSGTSEPLSIYSFTQPSHGFVTQLNSNSFTYTNTNLVSTDTFTYIASNDNGQTNTATVTITIIEVNEPPVANDDSYSTNQNETLNVSSPGIISNDSDPEDDSLTAILVNDVSNGTLSLSSNGSFTYLPDVGFFGQDSFTYKVNDGEDDSNIATVVINVIEDTSEPVMSWIAGGFLTGGDNILRSSDGNNWTYDRIPNLTDVRCLDYLNGAWIAGGKAVNDDGNTLSISTDGITWTSKSCPIDFIVMDVIYENNLYIAGGVSQGFVGTIAYSTDLDNWTMVPVSNTFDISTDQIHFDGSKFLAAGEHDAPGVTDLNNSINGTSWSREDTGVLRASLSIIEVNGVYLLGGRDFTGETLARSTDGINWSPVSIDLDTYVWDIEHINGKFIAGGRGTKTVATSVDGITWNYPSFPSSVEAIGGFANNGDTVIGVGAVGVDEGAIVRTTDGTSWTLVRNANQELYCIGAITTI